MRIDRRAPDEPRPTRIIPGFQVFAEGSALIEVGQTKVLCAATVEERVPAFLRSSGTGWVPAGYAMFPRPTLSRPPRGEPAPPGGGAAAPGYRVKGDEVKGVYEADCGALGKVTLTID